VADLDVFPDLEEVEEDPEEGDDEAGDHHEEEPVVVSQSEGDQTREPGYSLYINNKKTRQARRHPRIGLYSSRRPLAVSCTQLKQICGASYPYVL
jgi:hypothetical protein